MILHALVTSADDALAAVRGGATVVQLRLKDAGTETRARAGRDLRDRVRAAGVAVMFVMNDDVEAAIACAADAVHLGQDDAGTERALRHGLAVGRSVSSVDEARLAAAHGAAYLGAGPVWSTPSKPDAGRPIGLDGLARICAAVSIPVVAIGGINSENAGSCVAAGASGVAVIRALEDVAKLRAALDTALAPHPGAR